MLALVTGGAGFIGSHIVDRLLADGYTVRVLDNFSTGKLENLPQHHKLEVLTGDVGDFGAVLKASRDVKLVFHEAAVASVPRTVGDPLGSQRTNYLGTLNVLEAARQSGVTRVVIAASAAAYGDLPELPKREDMPLKPLSPYATDKIASEHACQVYQLLYGLDTACLRYFNVYGPRQDPSSPYSGVISRFADCLARGEVPNIFGDGGQTRDFVYVSDVVEANMRAAHVPGAAGEVFNIATGNACSLNDLLQTLCALRGEAFAPVYKSERAGDIRHSCADVSKASAILDWSALVDLEHGLAKMY